MSLPFPPPCPRKGLTFFSGRYVLVLILVGALISVIETIPGLHKQNP